jgi:hypothetical protein
MPNQYTALPLADRLWAKVDRSDTCWTWIGAVGSKGYGSISINGREVRVHVVAWQLAAGPIPDGMLVCHTCDVRRCTRNDDIGVYVVGGVEYERRGHLWLGTNAANLVDMRSKGRYPVGDVRSDAKISDDSIRAMRERYRKGGISMRALAREAGLSLSHTQRLLREQIRA